LIKLGSHAGTQAALTGYRATTKDRIMSNDPNELPSIEPTALAEVTGGLDDSDGKILTALQGIQDTIKSLGQTNNNDSWQQMLPFLLMAFGGGGSGHIYSGSGATCGCGCAGRGGCRRRR
jgi:hypothetical protein